MAHWKHTVNIAIECNRALAGQLPPQVVAKALTTRLRGIFAKGADEDLDVLIDALNAFAADPTQDGNDYDLIMDLLYDWADAERVWIETSTPPTIMPN